jgi:outer membrane receptor protein involved in Fe transport
MAIFSLLAMGLGLVGVAADGGAALPNPAAAPTQPAPAQTASADPPVPTVIVKGQRPKRRVDRERYALDKDLGVTGGTVAEALRRVPSVAVDARGRIYLRGRTDVQVYIDGQPSSLMAGDMRGLVLGAMPSNWISDIELITIPNAAMASGDGGPIINLVTRADHKPGGFASGDLSSNGAGRSGLNLTGSYGNGRLTANAGLTLRQETQTTSDDSWIEALDPAGGRLSLSQAQNRVRNRSDNRGFSGGLTFAPNPKNRLSVQLDLTDLSGLNRGQGQTLLTEAEANLNRAYDQFSRQSDANLGRALSLNWTYSDLDKGDTLKLNLASSRNTAKTRGLDDLVYRLPVLNRVQAERRTASRTDMSSLSLDYDRPLGEGQVTTGVNYSQTRTAAATVATGQGAIDYGLLANQSRDRHRISALYGTYQRPLGDQWGVQAGLRAELHQVGSRLAGREVSDRYSQWTPSLFVTYQAQPTAKWRLAYSHEQQTPSLEAKNPGLAYQDAQTLNQGNPNLKAQTTDRFELSYDRYSQKGYSQVRLFYAPTRGELVPVTKVLADGVIVRGQDNGGNGYGLGLDINTSRPLTQKLDLQLALGVAQNRRQAEGNRPEQATALSGQLVLNYNPTDKDNIALVYTVQGSGLTGQGTSKPFAFSNLNYNHSFSPQLTLTLDVQNLFGKASTRQTTETPNLITRSESRSEGRVIMLTLRRSFVRFEP